MLKMKDPQISEPSRFVKIKLAILLKNNQKFPEKARWTTIQLCNLFADTSMTILSIRAKAYDSVVSSSALYELS